VIEKNAPQEVHGERHLTDDEEAHRYLDEIAQKTFSPEVEVDNHVHSEEVRDVAKSITAHVSEFEPDLIIMCAHGRGGVRDVVMGSIAQQVISLGATPLLLLHPEEDWQTKPPGLSKFLIGLDGVAEHEASLNFGGDLALKLGAELQLVNVVQTPDTLQGERAAAGKLLPATTMAMLEMTESYALQYLEEKAARYRSQGMTVALQVRRGDPHKQLIKAAEATHSDVIVLGTHGKAGMGAFWSGSVAPKLVGQTRIPLLLVPVKRYE
jgi:nucleotide-binding universal stress UspA family protein